MPYSQTVTGLDELRRDLKDLPKEIIKEGKRIVGKGMSNIKKDAIKRVRVERWAHLPHLPRSFSYEVDTLRGGTLIRGVAGADMAKLQGRLDVYVEYGTATNPPNRHWSRSFDAELPNFERYAEEFLERLIR